LACSLRAEQLLHADPAFHHGANVDFSPGQQAGLQTLMHLLVSSCSWQIQTTSSIAMPGRRRHSQASWERNSGPCSANAHPKKAGILEDVNGKWRQCTICLLWFLRQEVLIKPVQYGDWQGQLSNLCYSCHRTQHPWRYCSQRVKDWAKLLSGATLEWKRHAFGDGIRLPHRVNWLWYNTT
jgi:hypothetical protein